MPIDEWHPAAEPQTNFVTPEGQTLSNIYLMIFHTNVQSILSGKIHSGKITMSGKTDELGNQWGFSFLDVGCGQ